MDAPIVLKTDHVLVTMDEKARVQSFIQRSTHKDWLDRNADPSFSYLVMKDGQTVKPNHIKQNEDNLQITYENSCAAWIEYSQNKDRLTFTLKKMVGENIDFTVFCHIGVVIDESKPAKMVASCMGMTLHTRMKQYPGKNSLLYAAAYAHTGFTGAKCAVIVAPESSVLTIMKKVLDEIPNGSMPKAAYSGPYAYRLPDASRTYTIGGADSLQSVDEYVHDMKKFGITQVHMHQGRLYRQGDFEVLVEGGAKTLRAMINRYHAHGVQVMLHSYTFFVDHYDKKVGNRYLSPVPHPDLGVCATFTLAEDLMKKDERIMTEESLRDVSDVFGYLVPESPILWIDDELIRFESVRKDDQPAFTRLIRGALGTHAADHKKGAKIKQLNSYFGYIAPEKNSALFYEIAKNTADFYNTFDFDGFYLDAIDGVFVLDGNEFAWYHACLFINELFKTLKKPPIFNCCYGPQYPGQWYARTRMGAFDSASRGYRDYTDAHVEFNETYAERMYLTGELGWWSLFPAADEKLGWQTAIMHEEDVEYICSKWLATDACMCWHGGFVQYKKIPKLESYAKPIMRYDTLKRGDGVPNSIKEIVRQKNTEFELIDYKNKGLKFRLTHTARHLNHDHAEDKNSFIAHNPFIEQTPRIRIEALYTGESHDSKRAVTLLKPDPNAKLTRNETFDLGSVNIDDTRAISVCIHGDHSGRTVKIALKSPSHIARGHAEFFIKVDFYGWRTFTFYEFMNATMPHQDWKPKKMDYKVFTDVESFYAVYSSTVDYTRIQSLDVMINRQGDGDIRIRSIKAVPHHAVTLKNPTLTVNGQALVFQTHLASGTYLQWSPFDNCCAVYDLLGHVLDRPDVKGERFFLQKGPNEIEFEAICDKPYAARAAVTLRMAGEVLE